MADSVLLPDFFRRELEQTQAAQAELGMGYDELDISFAPPQGILAPPSPEPRPPKPPTPSISIPTDRRTPPPSARATLQNVPASGFRGIGRGPFARPPTGVSPSTEFIDPMLEEEPGFGAEVTEGLLEIDRALNRATGGQDETISARVARRENRVHVWLADTLDRIDPGHTTRALDATSLNTWPSVPRELINCKKLR